MKILITGTSRGIGFGLTLEALRAGHTVFAVARNTETLMALCKQYPKHLIPIEIDISQPTAIQKLAQQIGNESLDVLINNAGLMVKGETADDLAVSFWINATVPFLLSHLPQKWRRSQP
jgi:NADP-dependent 3-hydroxy acid dehydrogenase YdfG